VTDPGAGHRATRQLSFDQHAPVLVAELAGVLVGAVVVASTSGAT
jgi:hypothetical protein